MQEKITQDQIKELEKLSDRLVKLKEELKKDVASGLDIKKPSLVDRLTNFFFKKPENRIGNKKNIRMLQQTVRTYLEKNYYSSAYSLGCNLYYYSDSEAYPKTNYVTAALGAKKNEHYIENPNLLDSLKYLPKNTHEIRYMNAVRWLKADKNIRNLISFLKKKDINDRTIASVVGARPPLSNRNLCAYDAIYCYYIRKGMQ